MTYLCKLWLPAAALTVSVACGGSPPPKKEVAPAAVVVAPLGPQDPLGPLVCPPGTTIRKPDASESGTQHLESWCGSTNRRNGPYRKDLRVDDELTVRLIDGQFVDDLRDGRWSFYRPDGLKLSRGAFRRGRPTGPWNWWYPNGQQRMLGDYMDGLRNGTWSYWYEDGTRVAEGMYLSGLREGEWRFLNAEGGTVRTEKWQRGKLLEAKGDDPPIDLDHPDFANDP